MKSIRKTILNTATIPFRFVIFLFGGRGKDKWIPAGRYTRPAMMKDTEPATPNRLVG